MRPAEPQGADQDATTSEGDSRETTSEGVHSATFEGEGDRVNMRRASEGANPTK